MEDQRVKWNEDKEDSEEELEKKDAQEEDFKLEFAFDEAAIPSGAVRVVVCSPGVAEALFRIILHPDVEEIGSVKATHKEETDEVVKLVKCKNLLVLQLTKDLKSAHCN